MLPELETATLQLALNRESFGEYFARADDAEVNRPQGGENYSPRQTLAHLAGAMRGMTRTLALMAEGANPKLRPDFDLNYYNARQQEKRANMTVMELLDEWDDARGQFLALLERLEAADLDKPGQHPLLKETDARGVIRQVVQHEMDHIHEILERKTA